MPSLSWLEQERDILVKRGDVKGALKIIVEENAELRRQLGEKEARISELEGEVDTAGFTIEELRELLAEHNAVDDHPMGREATVP